MEDSLGSSALNHGSPLKFIWSKFSHLFVSQISEFVSPALQRSSSSGVSGCSNTLGAYLPLPSEPITIFVDRTHIQGMVYDLDYPYSWPLRRSPRLSTAALQRFSPLLAPYLITLMACVSCNPAQSASLRKVLIDLLENLFPSSSSCIWLSNLIWRNPHLKVPMQSAYWGCWRATVWPYIRPWPWHYWVF